MRRRLPLRVAGLAAAIAAIWCWFLRDGFHQNAANADRQLYALWLLLAWVVALPIAALLALPFARRVRPREHFVLLTLLLLLPANWLLFALQRGGPTQAEAATAAAPSMHRILLLGIDGLDPGLLVQLIDAGMLSTFAQLREHGCLGELATVSPHSPVVWSSIATGATPEQHGIRGYTSEYLGARGWLLPRPEHDPLLPCMLHRAGFVQEGAVSADLRKQKAYWAIFAEHGLSTLTIGWWASYPTTPGAGIQISNRAVPWDRFDAEELSTLDGVRDLVEPQSLWPMVRATIDEVVTLRDAVDQDRDRAGYFATRDAIHWQLFQRLRAEQQSVASVYLQEVDTNSHAYTQRVFGGNPRTPQPMQVDAAQAQQWFAQSVVAAYRRMDAKLASLLPTLTAAESIVIVSDHGWRYDGSGHWSQPAGTLLCYGPAFAEGRSVSGATVYDILPTLAALCGVPRSTELPGRALVETLADPSLAERQKTVASHGHREPGLHLSRRGGDVAHLEKLRSLGYID